MALAEALTRAAEAGQWDVATTLARELQARRETRVGVVDLETGEAKLVFDRVTETIGLTTASELQRATRRTRK